MGRQARAVLSVQNLLHNLSVIKHYASARSIIAMIKANAYGHGIRSTALHLEHGVENFGVASIDEALALRKVGIKKPITLMEGVFYPDELLVASYNNFHVVFHQEDQIDWLYTMRLPQKIVAWLKIDTGMGRLGVSVCDVHRLYYKLVAHESINSPVGLMSHFACADDKDNPRNYYQISRFHAITADISAPTSFCNSAALFQFGSDEIRDTVVRPGISLYGISPIPIVSAVSLGLRPVMTLQTQLIAVRMVDAGDTIGYGARFTCPDRMPIGVIAIGYGDGYPRSARDGTPVLVSGVRCHIIGRVSMDMLTIDLRNYPRAQIGDQVILWGDGLPIEEVARYTHHIPYELVCGIQQRVIFDWTRL